jgi:hypothetical protein
MPILSSSIQRPPIPVAKTYTPAGGVQYKVVDGDTWAKLAAGAGIDSWALIRFNYPGLPTDMQQAARQVNWYLQEHVGCVRVTPDQRNYIFSSSAAPGFIWMPPAAPVAPLTPDEIARKAVLDTLREPTVAALNFGVGDLFIPARQYEMVAKAIEGGFITVKSDSTLSGSAVYYADANRINVPPYASATTIGQRALIIHECTHAIFDMRIMTSRVEESEGMAYLAQALYSELNGSNHRHIVSSDVNDPVSWFSWQMIFDEARRLAPILKRQYRVTRADAELLYRSIKGANFYRARAGKAEVYDGLPAAYYNGL